VIEQRDGGVDTNRFDTGLAMPPLGQIFIFLPIRAPPPTNYVVDGGKREFLMIEMPMHHTAPHFASTGRKVNYSGLENGPSNRVL
jgi:hypothetical protein